MHYIFPPIAVGTLSHFISVDNTIFTRSASQYISEAQSERLSSRAQCGIPEPSVGNREGETSATAPTAIRGGSTELWEEIPGDTL